MAALVLALLLTEAPRRARCHVYAVDTEQATIFADTLAGLVMRTPGLMGAVEVGARSVIVRQTGATLTLQTSDDAFAYGTRPWLTVVDELGAWPQSTNHRRLWSAIVSAVPKVPGARLLVIGTPGAPSAWRGSVDRGRRFESLAHLSHPWPLALVDCRRHRGHSYGPDGQRVAAVDPLRMGGVGRRADDSRGRGGVHTGRLDG